MENSAIDNETTTLIGSHESDSNASNLNTNMRKWGVAKKRCRTLKQKSEKNAMNHPLLPVCPAKCAKECSTKIKEEDRATINYCYWNLSFSARRQWSETYVLETVVKQRTVEIIDVGGNEQLQTPRRSFSRVHSLPLPNGGKIYVCKIMF